MSDEQWHRIPILPERFEATRDGEIRTRTYEIEHQWRDQLRRRTVPGRILKQRFAATHPRAPKQMIVGISFGGSRAKENKYQMRVAYLVAATFHGLPFDRFDIADVHRWKLRFKDGDVTNCAADNLEWVLNCVDTGDGQQARYEHNLEQWRSSDPAATLSRLFEGAAA
ncbi:hypothetical protein A5747_13630 [Mycobacterium sp. IS-836]|uniref:hypothetical protein n=1 Tax=Mycobacterium sp. IS-836 TaxID=1834160 RepID=UPI00096C1923|nr:hypothetical protein [Mycobacterium sp. IS-836]OMC55424.1 hypothetical protein A5747_13630 [Mycobacterium sp. IS-836]